MKNKKTIFLILATIAMVVLSVITVLTSLRLKELATVPVAPNVPVSQPKAQELNEPPSPICEVSFTVEAPVVTYACFETGCLTNADCEPLTDGTALICDIADEATEGRCVNSSCTTRSDCVCVNGLACTAKSAYADSVSIANKLADGATVERGDVIVYEISYKNTGDTTDSVTITDTLPAAFDVSTVVLDDGCSIASRVITCTDSEVLSGATETKTITATVLANATAGDFTNTADLVSGSAEESACSADLSLEELVLQCNEACTSDSQCPSDLICLIADGATSGYCRNEDCDGETDCVCPTATPTSTPTPTPTPTGTPIPPTCNSYCADASECPSGLICSENKCRNSACVDDNDCECTVPPGCNETCNPSNATNECAGGYICDEATNTCRNSACTGETDCTCAVVAGTTQTTETLPTAGSPIPSFLFLAGGALLVILGVLAVGL